MNLLLDTCSFVWFYSDPSKLSDRASELLRDPSVTLALSVVSVWVLLVKAGLGKLDAPGDVLGIVADKVRDSDLRILDVRLPHVAAVKGLPNLHRDPFDRLLVCQALA